MPEYDLAIGNNLYKVELHRKRGRHLLAAKVNNKPVELWFKERETPPFYPATIKIAEKTYRIELQRIDRHSPFTVKVNNVQFKAELKKPSRKPTVKTYYAKKTVKAGKGRTMVVEKGNAVSPMAGKIVSVKVKKGDSVKIGEVVCILEAMKMENEVTATKTGKVQEVNVTEGSLVNEGDILVTVE